MPIATFSEKIAHTLSTIKYGENPPELYEPIRYMMDLGGKRIRPLLTVLAHHLFEDEVDKVLMPAAGVEVFHNFTLMHDDIMDQAPLRRGQETVHEKWNANTAILSGDVMLVKAYELFFGVQPVHLPVVLKLFSRCAAEVCEGQQLDMNFETRTDVSIPEYLKMITLKTAVLLGFALELGAVLGNASEEDRKNLQEFGIKTGIAFQLRDDLLDVYGNAAEFGKLVGGDILAGKKTFLLLTAMEDANEMHRTELKNWLGKTVADPEEKVKAVTAIYDLLEVKAKTETRINTYFHEALQHLDKVNAPLERKEYLRALALSLMERTS
ncbi:polyprenyl synthetase family protein [Adhaeribacter sp. BT258]|uniref:Polyprenyl synthetase family protein n=1 Tax=Adhaeribacter terrigena TaxID=2793070 RepID=A0ABS1C2D8_9BACT|nr:polyprenyl synthetase family protein [Adhaeribacter terrigena]MBK0403561.1 polyprenyl synthetase family protein [Adhaeribacter terrigena]